MADLSKLKKTNRLGHPPGVDEASLNLAAPEVAPRLDASVQSTVRSESYSRRDGRSMRRSFRTIPFATRVSAEYDSRLREIAERDGLLLVELLEQSLEAYEKNKKIY